jgi:hypothetical protein
MEYARAVGEAIILTLFMLLVGLPFLLIVADLFISRRWRREEDAVARELSKRTTRAKLKVVRGGRGEGLEKDEVTK